uniref:Merozoite surface antigen-2c n=1 Tax=Babesia bovis TaxID=5865 RepID=U6C7T6_BABBO|nr:merozoite surface antigen-2c [Babesia bovis]BAO04538.1 merozoite surface antigen-2c [Babesia bovis]
MVSFNIITVAFCSILFDSPLVFSQKEVAPAKQENVRHLLFDDMKLFYDVMRNFGESKVKSILEKNFEAVEMEAPSATETQKNLKTLMELIKTNAPFKTSDFDTLNLDYLSGQSNEELFKLLIDAINGMKENVAKVNEYLTEEGDHSLTGDELLKFIYKELVYDDESEFDKEKLEKLYKTFSEDSNALATLQSTFSTFNQKKTAKDGYKFIEPVQTPERIEPQPSATGNLNGQPSKPAETPKPTVSSFTYGGLTVATLCYFVLSAF